MTEIKTIDGGQKDVLPWRTNIKMHNTNYLRMSDLSKSEDLCLVPKEEMKMIILARGSCCCFDDSAKFNTFGETLKCP